MHRSDFENDIVSAVDCMINGGIILYPTDTIWGIGCDARNSDAVERIYNLKKRADSKSMLVLVHNEGEVKKLAHDVPDITWQLLKVADKPLTLILDGAHGVAKELIANDGTLGIRITHEIFSNELCKRAGFPLVSTSANISGQNSPSSFFEISDEIIKGVDYIVKFRQQETKKAFPSNIIKLSKDNTVKILR